MQFILNWLQRANDALVVENTGDAIETGGGQANTGLTGTPSQGSKIVVRNTGDAVATGYGTANSGIDLQGTAK